MTLAIVTVLALVFTILAVMTTIKKEAHQLAPALASILWGVGVIVWLLFMAVAYAYTWPAANTYLATAGGAIGAIMALVSGIMIIVPLLTSWNTRQQDRWERYEERKLADRERILNITSSRSKRDLWYLPPVIPSERQSK